MKKQYQKPLVAIEHYELTQAIASCNLKIGFLDKFCVLKDPDSTTQMRNLAMDNVFTSGPCAKIADPDDDNNDGICYHTNMNAAFSS